MANLTQALEESKKISKERKFSQSIDLVVSLKEFDVKRQEKIEEFIRLPHKKAKKNKICALIGAELKGQAGIFDKVIYADDFPKWKEARKNKKLAREFDFFVAQATIMPQIAQTFGRFFGPLGKMPNPKSGAVVPPTANLAPLVEKLQNTARITVSKTPVVQCSVGNEKMTAKELSENATAVLNTLANKLPRGKENIGKIFVKTTMGKPVRVKW